MGIRAKIAEAFVAFTADLSGLKTGLKNAEKETAGTAGRISTALGTIGRIAFPAGVVAAIVASGKAAIDAADQMQEMSIKTGETTENLSVLKYAAEQSGSSIEEMGVAFKGMANSRAAALSGNKEAIRSFRDLGISVTDLRSISGKDLLVKVADGIADTKNKTDRLTLAQDVLGKSAQSLLPTMSELARGGYERNAAEAKKLGLILSSDLARSADELNDNIGRLTSTFKAGANPALQDFLPIVNAAISANMEGAASASSWLNPLNLLVKALRYFVIPIFLTATEIISTFASSAGIGLTSLGKASKLLITGNYGKAWDEFAQSGKQQMELFNGLSGRVQASMEKLFPVYAEVAQAQVDAGTTAADMSDSIAAANMAAREGIIQLQLQRAELTGNAAEAERLRQELDLMTAAKMRESGVSEQLIQRTIALAQSNRQYEASLKSLNGINQVTVAQLQEEKEWRDKTYATTQKALDLDLSMRKSRAELLKDTQALAAIEREAAEVAAQRRANDIALMETSLEEKKRLIVLSEQQLVAELAVIQFTYETGWKGTIQRTIAAHQAGAVTIDGLAQQTSQNLQYALGDAFYSAITGDLDNVDDAFRDFFRSLLRQIVNFMAQQAVLKLLGSFSGLGGGTTIDAASGLPISAAAGGAVFGGGIDFPAFAKGGMVQDPTLGLIGEGRFDEAVIPMPNGAVPVEMFSPERDTNVSINQRIVLDASVLSAMKSSPDEMITVVSSDILRGGQILNSIQSRVRK